MKLTGATLNTILNLDASHALYSKDGRWYHQLRDFPGILFDSAGYLLVATSDDYVNNHLLRKNKDLHIQNGISTISGYIKFTEKQLVLIKGFESHPARKKRNNKSFTFTPNSAFDVIAITRKPQLTLKPTEIEQIHRKICKGLYKVLVQKFGSDNIGCDCPTGTGTFIDIVRKEKKSYHFYEVKTYNDIRANIREAFGQLLEYAYWNYNSHVAELIIVSHKKPSGEVKEYLSFLRKTFSLPLYYQHFDINKQVLTEKV